jgi:membrane protease YdiL (CAAX protease family)
MDYQRPASPGANDFQPLYVIVVFLLALFTANIIGLGVLQAISWSQGVSLPDLARGLDMNSSYEERQLVRIMSATSHFFTFSFATLAAAVFLYREQWAGILGLRRWPSLSALGWSLLFILASFPLAQAFYWINRRLPMPAWAQEMEDAASKLVKALLVMDFPSELLLNLLAVAVVPAIGEELLFRGALQRFIERYIWRGHLAVWIAAAVFSAVHLQFAGFFPRLILGAALGYLFLWSRNLWLPIVAHFIFNASQVLAQYFAKAQIEELDPERFDAPQWALAAAGLAVMILTGRMLRRASSRKSTPDDPPTGEAPNIHSP